MQLIGFYPIRMTQVEDNIMVECTQKTTLRYKGRIVMRVAMLPNMQI